MHGSQIVLEFFDEQGPGLILGTMVLHIGSDLRTLRGASTYFHHDKGRVISSLRKYKRVDDNAPQTSTSPAAIDQAHKLPESVEVNGQKAQRD